MATYTISDLAREFDLTTRAMRFYEDIGLLRLTPEPDGLGLRDLQILPTYRNKGVGSWALSQAQSIAASRGFQRLQLRVYEDNPAKRLYERMGFDTDFVAAGTVHMAYELPPNNSFKPRPLRGSA